MLFIVTRNGAGLGALVVCAGPTTTIGVQSNGRTGLVYACVIEVIEVAVLRIELGCVVAYRTGGILLHMLFVQTTAVILVLCPVESRTAHCVAGFAIAVKVDAVGPGHRLATVTAHVIAGDRRTATNHEGLVEFGVAVLDVYAGRCCRVIMVGSPGAFPLVANKAVARNNRDDFMGAVRQVAVRSAAARCRAVRRDTVTGDAIRH